MSYSYYPPIKPIGSLNYLIILLSNDIMNLIHGDAIEQLKLLPAKSIDFVYLDLPYGQTAVSWDKKLDLTALWKELKRVAKNDRTPFFFSCTTRFGYELIKANEKWFRWDLVWKKNRAAGFLNAYKLPMRKHEMIYCFSKKAPEYDVSSHKDYTVDAPSCRYNELYDHPDDINVPKKRHKERLPDSDVTPPKAEHELVYCFSKKAPEYDVSSHKDYTTDQPNTGDCELYGLPTKTVAKKRHIEKLPDSVITPPSEEHELVYCFAKKTPEYDVSSHKDFVEEKNRDKTIVVTKDDLYAKEGKQRVNGKTHKEPLPTSYIDIDNGNIEYETYGYSNGKTIKRTTTCHNERLPTTDITPSSWCDIPLDEKTGHRTAKPIQLMEFLLKYWTKPDWTVLDPTMGSGSMGIACKKMGRKFIGIELDPKIYELAKDRISKI